MEGPQSTHAPLRPGRLPDGGLSVRWCQPLPSSSSVPRAHSRCQPCRWRKMGCFTLEKKHSILAPLSTNWLPLCPGSLPGAQEDGDHTYRPSRAQKDRDHRPTGPPGPSEALRAPHPPPSQESAQVPTPCSKRGQEQPRLPLRPSSSHGTTQDAPPPCTLFSWAQMHTASRHPEPPSPVPLPALWGCAPFSRRWDHPASSHNSLSVALWGAQRGCVMAAKRPPGADTGTQIRRTKASELRFLTASVIQPACCPQHRVQIACLRRETFPPRPQTEQPESFQSR